jgi:hypothetical protein
MYQDVYMNVKSESFFSHWYFISNFVQQLPCPIWAEIEFAISSKDFPVSA